MDSDGRVPFFLNGNHVPDLPAGDLDVATLNRLRKRHRAHFHPRGLGVDHAADRGDYFTARTAALRELASWLNSEIHDRRARVVTGRPGSGKSALLGRLLLLTDPDHPARKNTASDAVPRAGMVIVALHARRGTCESLTSELAAAFGRPEADRDELLEVLAQRATPVAVLVDALDEAGTSGDSYEGARIGRELLQPLTTLPALRLIVGTRDPLIPTLGQAVSIIDLDDPRYITGVDIASYARDVLLDAQDPDGLSPYRDEPELARTIGQAIAARAGTSFLVARMTARALVHGQITIDITEPGWKETLPSDAGQAFAAYLDRFGGARPKVERLLRPLAYAQGAGLPWSTLWAPLAEALSGMACPTEDLRWLQERASAYLIESLTHHESRFRLFHETMAEYLRTPHQDSEIHRAITAALLDRVAIDPVTGRRQWSTAHPYIRDHLATHAAAGNQLDALVADPDYLVHAHPDELLISLHTITTGPGRLLCAIYRASAAVHRHLSPLRRRQLLATDAARFGATDQHRLLAETLNWQPRWATGQQANLALRATLTGHTRAVSAVACTEVDGQPIAITTSDDNTARVWDLATGTMLAVLDYTGYTTGALCIGPAQEIILGSGWDLLVIDRGGPGR